MGFSDRQAAGVIQKPNIWIFKSYQYLQFEALFSPELLIFPVISSTSSFFTL
jgi:hypothetical protein